MKAELVVFANAENGMALKVIPETDAERVLLNGLWQHGIMDRAYPNDHIIHWAITKKLEPPWRKESNDELA